MKQTTLCFLMDGDQICLAMKKRGFGAGRWNGAGGKLEEGETPHEAAVRELKEELGVDVAKEHLTQVGDIDFLFNERPEWNQKVNIFFVEKWEGEPQESEEMLPKWHHKNELPYDEMWIDDKHWMPHVLSGKKIQGHFCFKGKGEGDEIDTFEIREI